MSASDPARGIAKQVLRDHFTNKIGEAIKTPYYQTQIQVLYENDFFPWIISDALRELVREGFLVMIDNTVMEDFENLEHVKKIKFYAHNKTFENERSRKIVKKHALNIARIVDKYSEPQNSHAIGKHLEFLVKHELRANEFEIIGEHTNELNGIKWTRTNHNLDFIAKHKSGNLTIGIEVKNTLDIMEPDEIDTKIDICRHLGIVPVFAVRWIKPYMHCIQRQGGFCWIFKTQIYPFGAENFVKEVYEKLSELNKTSAGGVPLHFPITVRGDLPVKSIRPFVDWVNKNKNTQPVLNTSYRCKSN